VYTVAAQWRINIYRSTVADGMQLLQHSELFIYSGVAAFYFLVSWLLGLDYFFTLAGLVDIHLGARDWLTNIPVFVVFVFAVAMVSVGRQ